MTFSELKSSKINGVTKRKIKQEKSMESETILLENGKLSDDSQRNIENLNLGNKLNKRSSSSRKKLKNWQLVTHDSLPEWLQDNNYLKKGHRPPLPSFQICFKSIFRIHTETANIWTHLLGCIVFIGVSLYFYTPPSIAKTIEEKIAFGAFFLGAILCLAFSTLCHTLTCHSHQINKLFSKLDYCGIALVIMGSFVPWLYYCFYCHYTLKVIYLSIICSLGTICTIVSLYNKFLEPSWRPFRAGIYIIFGLSGAIPALHYAIMEGFLTEMTLINLGWLILSGSLYIIGALQYAMRIPERWWPGKFDIWFHSHQIFHLYVLGGAFVHYHGIIQMATQRAVMGECKLN